MLAVADFYKPKNTGIQMELSRTYKKYYLKFSEDDTNIKDIVVNGNLYVEWIISTSNIDDFLELLSFAAKNGFFETEAIDYLEDILNFQEQLSMDRTKLSKKFDEEVNKNILNELNYCFLKKDDNFPIQVQSNQGLIYLFHVKIPSNQSPILKIISQEKQRLLSVLFSIKNSVPYNRYEFELDDIFTILWLNICKMFLYMHNEQIIAKLKEIKPIVDEIEQQRIAIKNAIKLDLSQYYIVVIAETYIIRPIFSKKETLLDTRKLIDIKDFDIFNQLTIVFENCMFNCYGVDKAMIFTKKISFNECVFKSMVSFNECKIQEKVSFRGTIFEGTANFQSVQFHKDADFSQVTFKQMTLFSTNVFALIPDESFAASCFKKKALFTKSIFEHNVSFVNVVFYGDADFDYAIFQAKVVCCGTNFSGAQFQREVKFNSIFGQDVNFDRVIFKHDVHFNGAEFRGKANFISSKFYEDAFFYEVIFQKIPNFFQAIFKESINFTNTKLDFGFPDMQQRIETYYTGRQKFSLYFKQDGTLGTDDKKEEYKIANEFRDSFRTIKSALIKDNNMLDASNYHRVELYCKELELEYKRREKAKTFWEKFKFILSNGKDFVDEIQLYCYRFTSDHHTNLLMILNNVIFLIALFGLANLMLIPFDETYTISFFKINVIETIVCLIFMSTAICFIFGSWKIFMLKPIYLLLLFLFLALVFSFSPILVLVVLSIYSAILLSAVLLLLLFSYFLIKIQKILDLKQCIFILSYLITAFMLFSSPSSILPILGKLIENKSGEMCLFVIGNVKLLCCGGASSTPETLNLIYMLFLFLLLWSLQKTARKNTIVPS